MPSWTLTEPEALREVAEVENALFDGYPARTLIGSHGFGAIRIAARRLAVPDQSLRRRIGSPEQPGAIQRRYGFGVDWSMYREPARQAPAEPVQKESAPEVAVTAQEHADARARELARLIGHMITSTRYPVVNPDSLMVEPRIDVRYDRDSMDYKEVERAPRTWVSSPLRVAPVADARNRTFIFTGAQNDCPIHEGFWANLQAYAAFLGADIVVGPWTYETAWFSEGHSSARAYDPKIFDHIAFGSMEIGDNFVFCAEMNTLPTASRPISDLVTYSRGRFAVFPHAKIQLKSVPSTDPNVQAHQVMTTGAVTLPKVIPRKAGVKSIFHQILGAVIVEFDEAGDLFCRQLSATDDGAFYDLDRHISGGVVTTGHRIKVLVCGDIHVRKLDPSNTLATFGLDLFSGDIRYVNNIVDTLKPEYILLHDVFDNESKNHHNIGDAAYTYEMAIRGRDNVLGEIMETAKFIASVKRDFTKVRVIESNHDLGLERYIREGRYRNDGGNMRVGLQLEDAYMAYRDLVAAALDRYEEPPSFSLFEYAARSVCEEELKDVEWIHDGKSFTIDGIECGHHGFRGANGSKGTISGFARMGRKLSIGDKHSPEIMDGVYCAGCMSLNHRYNKGPSSWAVSSIVHYVNGKRSLITIQSGKWRAERPRVRVAVSGRRP